MSEAWGMWGWIVLFGWVWGSVNEHLREKSGAQLNLRESTASRKESNLTAWLGVLPQRGDWQRGGPSLDKTPQRRSAGASLLPTASSINCLYSWPQTRTHIWPIEFSAVQNSLNWFSPALHCTQTQVWGHQTQCPIWSWLVCPSITPRFPYIHWKHSLNKSRGRFSNALLFVPGRASAYNSCLNHYTILFNNNKTSFYLIQMSA